MTPPDDLLRLVETFDRNIEDYKSGSYNEANLRQEYVNPLFELLGWDIYNKRGRAEAYKDVVHEESIKIGDKAKAPDYCFRVGGTRKFFLEAKKPSINIKEDINPAFQLRRYAWSAKLPLSILTDFEEFAVYDCSVRPVKTDKASTARSIYFPYTEYLERWDEISSVFSREAILQGSFDKYADSHKAKRGTASVDGAFLKEVESWRDLLARNIALRNPEIEQRQLNFAVQMIIDRVIFLRICEDRQIEDYGRLRALRDKPQVYRQLSKLFREADDRYNSGLFHFRGEKDRQTPHDNLTLRLKIDDKPLKDIIGSLYYPESPYEFSVLPPDILGQVYEQFLGKVIRLTSGHQARVEYKPEVKKAGGVYYTPTYIVNYIIKNTVGKLLEGKKPGPRGAVSKLKILDPACGSGSFLIGAYQYLLDWHIDKYVKDGPGKHKKALYQAAGGGWRLTTAERKRILLNNIYGVDIDPQAVEVTKLSLLLKVLEGESGETLAPQLIMFHMRALPDLGSNIKCGNSLIGPDFYDNRQLGFFDEDEQYRINVFDWNAEFPEIMNSGGFDVVIGNPPYLRIQGLQEFFQNQIGYFIQNFQSAVKRFDLYLLFAEKGFNLLAKNGRLGFICPHKFLNSDFGSGLRGFLLKNSALESFVSFGNNLIFNQATTYTGILLLSRNNNTSFNYSEFPPTPSLELPQTLAALKEGNFANYKSAGFTSNPWALTSTLNKGIFEKLIQQPATLSEVFESIFQGIVTGIDEIYFLKKTSSAEKRIIEVFSQSEGKNIKIEKDILKPILKGEDVSRYKEPDFKYYCIYPYKLIGNKTVILQEDEISTNFPLAYEYLRQYMGKLKDLRIKYKTNPKYWYSCHRARLISDFESNRIITPEVSLGCNMTISNSGFYHNTMVYSFLPSSSQLEDLNFWLGLLNSKIFWWFIANTGNVLRGGYFRFKTKYIEPFPIRTIDFSKPKDKERHDKMVKLVERMLDLNKKLQKAKVEHDKTIFKRQIDSTDKQIDNLAYELYGLTKKEIAIVEGSS